MKKRIGEVANRLAVRAGLSMPRSSRALEEAFLDPVRRNAYFLAVIPSLAFFGISVRQLNHRECIVEVPFSWRSQNPFRSVYFAAQSAAAELSTGALVLRGCSDHPGMSMLVVSVKAQFTKKAKARVTFTCLDGEAIHAAIARAAAREDGGAVQNVTATAIGRLPDETEVSRFTFEWAVRARRLD